MIPSYDGIILPEVLSYEGTYYSHYSSSLLYLGSHLNTRKFQNSQGLNAPRRRHSSLSILCSSLPTQMLATFRSRKSGKAPDSLPESPNPVKGNGSVARKYAAEQSEHREGSASLISNAVHVDSIVKVSVLSIQSCVTSQFSSKFFPLFKENIFDDCSSALIAEHLSLRGQKNVSELGTHF